MTDFVFNFAKGRVARYADLPLTNDALIVVPLETSGLETASTLKDYDDLSSLLAGTTNEQTTMGRKTAASVTVTPDDTNDRIDVDMADPAWTGATGNAISGILVCYDDDTTGGSDTSIVPLVFLDMVATPNGGDLTYVVASGGFYRAS